MQRISNKLKLILALFAGLFFALACVPLFFNVGVKSAKATSSQVVYVDYGSTWKYSYDYVEDFYTVDITGSSVESTAWNEDDAPFAFAEYGQYDTTQGTEVESGHLYYNFTKTFNVDTVSNALSFNMYFDDAVALYLNGHEIYRDNLSGINFVSVQNGDTVDVTVGTAKETQFNIVTSYLVEGTNVITAIVAEDFKAGNDAYFDMKITGIDTFEVLTDDMPDTIALSYYDDPFTTRGVAFYTGLSLNQADLRYRKVGETSWNNIESTGEPWYGRLYHKATITELAEETEYEYQIGSSVLDTWGKTYTFKTEKKTQKDDTFSFSFLTDTQSSNAWEFSIWQTMMGYMSNNGHIGDFLVHGGDIVESSVSATNLVPEQWREGFNALEGTLTSTPIVPVAGNHEYSAYAFVKHFNINYASFNDSGAYYSFDYGNAHIVVLNTNDIYFGRYTDASRYQAQVDWLEEDLSTTDKTWKIVMMHFPAIVTQVADGTEDFVRNILMPVFAKNDVDLVMNGHTHKYFRSAVYGHTDNLLGADEATTRTNIKNSAIAEEDLVTYTDLSDGTIYTVNPNGTTYVTVKSSNYNVYYQNISYQLADEECLFATNPLNGKVMNGGQTGDDTGFLMNKMQYVNVEVGTDTLKCNVYNANASTGETELWDTYCVLKSDNDTLNEKISSLPNASDATTEDFSDILSTYSMFDALGVSTVSETNLTKINALKAALPVDSIKKIANVFDMIEALDASDAQGYTACETAYSTLSDAEKAYVDRTKLDDLKLTIAVTSVELAIKDADAIETRKLTKETVDKVIEQYNSLNEDQKSKVSNSTILDSLNNKLSAQPVMAKIDLIKTSPTKSAIEEADKAYNELSASAKVYVDNVDVLTLAKTLYAETDEVDEVGFWTFAGGGLWIIIGVGVLLVAGGAVLTVFLLKKKKGSLDNLSGNNEEED